jgi:multicomponent Na+:H+ antiporter subunit C
MQYFPFVVVAWILGVGLYGIVTSRHLVHLIMCLIVVQSSTYVLLLGVGYVTGAVAPYFYDIGSTPAVDPVAQALALTDVVVEAAVTALSGVRGPGPQAVLDPGPQELVSLADSRAWTTCSLSSWRAAADGGAIFAPTLLLGDRRGFSTRGHRGGRVRRRDAGGHHGAHGLRGDQVYWFGGFRSAAASPSASTSRRVPSAPLASLAAVPVTASMTSPGGTSAGWPPTTTRSC